MDNKVELKLKLGTVNQPDAQTDPAFYFATSQLYLGKSSSFSPLLSLTWNLIYLLFKEFFGILCHLRF